MPSLDSTVVVARSEKSFSRCKSVATFRTLTRVLRGEGKLPTGTRGGCLERDKHQTRKSSPALVVRRSARAGVRIASACRKNSWREMRYYRHERRTKLDAGEVGARPSRAGGIAHPARGQKDQGHSRGSPRLRQGRALVTRITALRIRDCALGVAQGGGDFLAPG